MYLKVGVLTKIAINILLLFTVLTACTSAPHREIVAYTDFPETIVRM